MGRELTGRLFKSGWTGVLLLAVLLALFVFRGAQAGDAPGAVPGEEGRAVAEAARSYLEAEVRRDFDAVWALLAPSSVYCETHDYRAYREEAERSPVRIERFDIVRVVGIRPNQDPARFPKVERFADVEVDLVLYFTDTGTRTEVNHRFTFIREGGRWYKG
jgi:hypothetical protein